MNNSIKSWLEDTIVNDTWRNFNSLHIDEIDQKYESKNNWFIGGINCLRDANNKLKQLSIRDKKVLLLLSLSGKDEKQGINFNAQEELENQFDATPPSLYVYEENWEGFVDTLNEGRLISNEILNISGIAFFHVEYKEEGDLEYRRSIISVMNE